MAFDKKGFFEWLPKNAGIPASEVYPGMVERLEGKYKCDLSKMSSAEISALVAKATADMEIARVNKHLDRKGFNTDYETPISALQKYLKYHSQQTEE